MSRRPLGFTIVEIAVVVTIISILATLTVVAFTQFQANARNDRRTADIGSLKRAIVHYYHDNGEYPACTNSGSGCAVSAIASSIKKYMASVPLKDPQGSDYLYWPGTDQYALFVSYEPSSSCKTGINMDSTWWSSTADCKAAYPNRF